LQIEKKIQNREYEKYFIKREGHDAVEHLFYLASGLKSQILGEDQILTQVKDALGNCQRTFYHRRSSGGAFSNGRDSRQEDQNRSPIFPMENPSVIHQAIQMLEKQGYSVKEKVCMVIGNGEMGKVAAQTLMESGADVTVTVRQYRSGMVSIPFGCKRINYGERMEYLPKCDLVVSATASPNFTLREELFEDLELEKTIVLIDLAVPRDIEPEVGRFEGVTLYDMDSFKTDEKPAELQEHLEAAGKIVREQMDEFFKWLEGKDLIPRIQEIKENAVNDFNLRIMKPLKNTHMEEQEKEQLLSAVDRAMEKVVNKMLFGLRDSMNEQAFLECVAGLEKTYEK